MGRAGCARQKCPGIHEAFPVMGAKFFDFVSIFDFRFFYELVSSRAQGLEFIKPAQALLAPKVQKRKTSAKFYDVGPDDLVMEYVAGSRCRLPAVCGS